MMRKIILAIGIVIAFTIGFFTLTNNDSEEQETPRTASNAQEELATEAIHALGLPERAGSRRQTTGSVPHQQIGAEPIDEVDTELRRRVFQLPGVENRDSDRSLPGARGLALSDEVTLARPDVIAGSNEFAHIHPDGSLHVWLPVAVAQEVNATKWGELHPWVTQAGFWDGVVMLYTPESLDELEVTIQIIVEAYNFVVGADLVPADIP